tara:strand:- start:710 stop:1168 length:459 start_codon:yes stop_codon:yes gene_type:complete
MSHFSQVQDLLLHNQQLHARTASFYDELSGEADGERVKMFLNTLVKHETQLSNSMQNYVKKAPAKILNTFFQFDHERSIENLFTIEFDRSQISSDDVEVLANRFDEYFCELYEEMLVTVDCVVVQELFENLHLNMVEEKKRLSIDIYSMMDM